MLRIFLNEKLITLIDRRKYLPVVFPFNFDKGNIHFNAIITHSHSTYVAQSQTDYLPL